MPLLEVCLVDNSPIKGYLGAVLKKPDVIVWLRTSNQRKVVSQIESAISGQLSTSFESREIIKDGIDEFVQQCEQIIKDYPEHDILLDVSGGLQLYALLATEVFKNADKEVTFIDTNHSRIINIKTGEYKTFHFTMTVNEYIALQGVQMDSGTRFDPEIGKRSTLSYFIGNNMERVIPFIDKIREEWIDMGDNKKNIQWRMDDPYHRFTIIYESSDNKMRFRFGVTDRQKTFEITKDGSEYLFSGGWLRELTFLRVHRSQYDDVRLNVRLNRDTFPEGIRAESMIDISMMKGCNFYIFQCFSYPVTRESFIELKAVQTTVQLLNAKGFIFMAHRPHRGFIERVHDGGLEVVYGRRLCNFSL